MCLLCFLWLISFLTDHALLVRDVILELLPIFVDHRFDRHGTGVTENTNGDAFHVRTHIENHIEIFHLAMPMLYPMQHLLHPPRSFPTLRTLSACFLGVEASGS